MAVVVAAAAAAVAAAAAAMGTGTKSRCFRVETGKPGDSGLARYRPVPNSPGDHILESAITRLPSGKGNHLKYRKLLTADNDTITVLLNRTEQSRLRLVIPPPSKNVIHAVTRDMAGSNSSSKREVKRG